MRREAQFQILFKRWLTARWGDDSAAFELKRTQEDSLPFNALEIHQKENLIRASMGFFYYKIPDDSIGQKPFDCFVLSRAKAYVVIAFGVRLKEFFLIPIEVWIELERNATRKSIHVNTLRDTEGVTIVTV